MTHSILARIAALYLPLTAALVIGLLKPRHRQFPAVLLSLLWTAPTLLILQNLNLLAHWWTFASPSYSLRAMPIELYLGWLILWGALPQLAFPRLNLIAVATTMIALDLIAMPLCQPLLLLGPHWLIGEAVAAALVLLPALLFARYTLTETHLFIRATLQVFTSGMLFLYFLPEVAFAARPGLGWWPVTALNRWQLQIAIQLVAILALPGVAAVQEFATSGRGTPIPYDPPRRLVTTGIYRYVANPMQLSCVLVTLAWAALLHNQWLLLIPAITIVYSAGIAHWDEEADLTHRFPANLLPYRAAVRAWLPHWRPYANPPPRLYIAYTCVPCTGLRHWIEARHPIGVTLVPAETLPPGSINRLRYVPSDGEAEVEGLRAVARTLDHLNLGWAICGAALRLPIVCPFIQVLMDASGLGPRQLSDTPPCPTPHSPQPKAS